MGEDITLNAQTGLPYTARSEYFWVNCGQRTKNVGLSRAAVDGKSDNYQYTTVPVSAGNDENNNDVKDMEVDDGGGFIQFPASRTPVGNGFSDTCPQGATYSLTGACISHDAGTWRTWTGAEGMQEHRISGVAGHQNFFPAGAEHQILVYEQYGDGVCDKQGQSILLCLCWRTRSAFGWRSYRGARLLRHRGPHRNLGHVDYLAGGRRHQRHFNAALCIL
jgi:hypothetical protein